MQRLVDCLACRKGCFLNCCLFVFFAYISIKNTIFPSDIKKSEGEIINVYYLGRYYVSIMTALFADSNNVC